LVEATDRYTRNDRARRETGAQAAETHKLKDQDNRC
jgi:hypothetical protein